MSDITLTITESTATVNGVPIEPRAGQSLREAAIHHVARQYAQPTGESVQVSATDSAGNTALMVHVDGTTTLLDDKEPAVIEDPVTEPVPVVQAPAEDPARSAAPRGATSFAAGDTFLAQPAEAYPAPTGWRGLLHSMGFHQEPTEAERRARQEERAVSQHWPGTRSIAIVNGKGGSGKTPTTALLAAQFARGGGSGVLAWDCNITRGTLGWRTEQGPHDSTIHDLLPHAERLLGPAARASDLVAYVHHQIDDKYDVLRSNPLLLSTDQKITTEEMDQVHTALAKYYRLILMDSGNDEGDDQWLRMVDHSDQLVVPTTTRPDHAEAARLLLVALSERDEHSAHLARRAVVVVSQADREERDAKTVATTFAELGLSAITVPYDPAMRKQWIRHDSLAPRTQDAYRRAAAEIADRL